MYKAKRKKISLATKKKKGNKKIRLKGVEEISVDRQNNKWIDQYNFIQVLQLTIETIITF